MRSISACRLFQACPSYTDIFVKPSFSANINGAPLHIGGASKPFHSSHESTVDLDIDKLQINKYLEYSPLALNFKVPSGELNGKLNASFKTAKDSPSVFTITGNLALNGASRGEKRRYAVRQDCKPRDRHRPIDDLQQQDRLKIDQGSGTGVAPRSQSRWILKYRRSGDGFVEDHFRRGQGKTANRLAMKLDDILIESSTLQFSR